MTYLLDVNALRALAFHDHSHHRKAEAWISALQPGDRLATCAITELGFVRIAPQARLSPDVTTARNLLGLLRAKNQHRLECLTDDLGAEALPAWVRTPAQTTDGHLMALAAARGAQLATFDAGIVGALLIP